MEDLFNDIYNDNIDLSLEIIEEQNINRFKTYFENINNYKYKIDNINTYKIEGNEITLIFSKKIDKSINKNILILPIKYIIESPHIISYLDINYEINENESIILYLVNHFNNNEPYKITEEDITLLSNLLSKLNISEIIFYGCFKSVDLYYKFNKMIYENFKIYPFYYFLTQIKETEKHKKYYYISSFIMQDKISKETLLYNGNIKIVFKRWDDYFII